MTVPPVRLASLRPVPATAREMKSNEMTASIEPALVREAAFRLRLPTWPGAMVVGSASETAGLEDVAVRSRLSWKAASERTALPTGRSRLKGAPMRTLPRTKVASVKVGWA